MKARKDVFDKIFDVCFAHINDDVKAFDKMLEFLLIDHSPQFINVIPNGFDWVSPDNELTKKILEVYTPKSVETIKNDRRDHLGDMYIELKSLYSKRKTGQFFTPENVCDMMAQMVIGEGKHNVLDPCTGSGRMLLAAARVNPDVRCYGVDIDLGSLHVALCNCAIHNVHGFFLHADSLEHVISLEYSEGVKNWQFANSWESHWNELIPMRSLLHRIGKCDMRITSTDRGLSLSFQDLKDNDKVAARREEIKKATIGL